MHAYAVLLEGKQESKEEEKRENRGKSQEKGRMRRTRYNGEMLAFPALERRGGRKG